MATLWQNALVIAMDDAHGAEPFRADVLVDGDHFVSVRAVDEAAAPAPGPGPEDIGASAGDERDAADTTTVVDASGLLLVPGLVNAHTHSWEVLLRGTSDRVPLEVWTLLSYPPVGVAPVPQRLVYLRTMVAAIESLLGGTTTVLDDVGELPRQTLESIDAVFAAYDDAGLRATCTGTVVDVPMVDRLPFADDVLPADVLAASREAMRPSAEIHDEYFAFCDAARTAASRHAGGSGRIRFAVAPSAPQRSTDELLLRASSEARRHGEVLHMHLLETKLQAEVARTRYDGRTIVQHLDDLGVLGPNVTLAHGIWLTADDLALLARSGATVVHNPLSNLKLGSGVLPWRAMHDAGVRVALGSDGASSNDSLRMLEVMKAAALVHTLTEPDYRAWPRVEEVLRAATTGGARAAGRAGEVGSIAPGLKADFVVFDLTTSTSFTPLNDAARQLVFAENGASIAQVWIDGRLVVSDGRCTLIDADALLAEFRVEAARYLVDLPQWEALRDELEPFVRDAYRRTWSADPATQPPAARAAAAAASAPHPETDHRAARREDTTP
ncbi:amidohydrolase family protein [Herbiconiux daphne]|uniref:Amidohydrolase family protein n=1 Tax=Herbiconiux daphne TaxID=2970914 RepID=A0ABT2H4Z1_9MICO|nr:amidohydrolase family protein [Herbiconiux daphne]MCS5734990.1 amidohydrolase family protein [Herbiconiux daphne]